MILFKVGDRVLVGGLPYRVSAVNVGKGRFTLTPIKVVDAYDKGDEEGRFIDHEYLNGDPVWAVLKNEDGAWLPTAKPQTIHNYAYGNMLAVAGEEPALYGYQFVERTNLFPSYAEAEAECQRRNK